MKILYLAAAAEIGGGNRSLLTLWSGLRARGIDVHAICPADGPMVAASRELDVPCEVIPYRQPSWREPFALARNYRGWRVLIEKIKPDIVHANDLLSARASALARRRLGVPLVCHVRMPPEPDRAFWTFRGLPKPDAIVFNSQALREESGAVLHLACPSATQHVVHNAVELEALPARGTSQRPACRIGIIANLAPVKGHDDFLAMARRLVDRGVPCEFWIVGKDITGSGYERHLASLVAELRLDDAVRFTGYRADVAAVLDELDIVVSTSRYESFGRTLVEAMAVGKPVVAPAVGGMREVVADGVTGYLVAPRDVSMLADRVETLIFDSAARTRMGRAGQVHARETFGLDAHVGRILDVYRQVLGRGAASQPVQSVQEAHV